LKEGQCETDLAPIGAPLCDRLRRCGTYLKCLRRPSPPPAFSVVFGAQDQKASYQGQGNYTEQDCFGQPAQTNLCEVSRAIVSGDSFSQAFAFASGSSPVGAPVAAASAAVKFYFTVLGSRSGLVPIQVTFTGAPTALATDATFGYAGAQIVISAITPGGSAGTYVYTFGSQQNYPIDAGTSSSGTVEFNMGVAAYADSGCENTSV